MEVDFGGLTYRIGQMPVIEQFHLARKLTPVMAAIAGKDDVLGALGGVLGDMSVEDANFILFGLLKPVSRKLDGGLGWAPVVKGSTLMYQDIALPDLMQIAFASLQSNLGSFLPGLPAAGSPDSQA